MNECLTTPQHEKQHQGEYYACILGTYLSYLGRLSKTASSLGFFLQFLVINEREEGVLVLHIVNGSLQQALGWSQYQDATPVLMSQLIDDLESVPLRPVGV